MSALIFKSAVFLMLTLKAFAMPLKAQVSTNSIYYNVTQKDVGAIKFHCINKHICTITDQYKDIFGVSACMK